MSLMEGIGGILGMVIDIMLVIIPLWTVFLIGVLVGWTWRPSWASLDRNKFDYFVSKIVDFSAPYSPSKEALAEGPKGFGGSSQNPSSLRTKSSSRNSLVQDSSSSKLRGEALPVVSEDDLRYLSQLVDEKDGGPSWIQMMNRSTPTMSYRAWRRDVEGSPPQYRSSTIFEDATPEMVRDFFWDDEFRSKWDDMLIHAKTLEECPSLGTMLVHWVRKFPFFCSDREYMIGRRIWDCEMSYYCVTKGVPSSSVPRRDKPRRVDLYYSSWCIRAVESTGGSGQKTACEVLLFHYEDMGIPWEIAKLGVRQGMWGAVKKIEPGLRAYQKARAAGEPLSRQAVMAQINTKVSIGHLRSLMLNPVNDGGSSEEEAVAAVPEKNSGMNIPKALILGGAVALACSVDRGLLTKAVIFGVARRIGRMGGKL